MYLIKRLKRNNTLIQDCSHNKQAYSYAYIPRSLSVGDNVACLLKRKKYQSRDTARTNKPDRYACIPRSLSVSDDVMRLKRKKSTNDRDMYVYLVL